MSNNDQTLKIAYLSGPVDAFDVYDKWSKADELGYFGASHVREFFDVCTTMGAEAYLITTLPAERICQHNGSFLIENRPAPCETKGIFYHLTHVYWMIGILLSVLRFRPDVFIITAGQNYWLLLVVLRLWNIPILPVINCTLWPKFRRPSVTWRALLQMNRRLFFQSLRLVIAQSEDIVLQVRKLVSPQSILVITYLPIYSRSQFSSFSAPQFDRRPFTLFFAGRIEANKGIYDLIEITDQLNTTHPGQFRFDVCGDGSQLTSMKTRIEQLQLQNTISCHGYCERRTLSSIMSESHAVIVPTTTGFEEGFNMVCAEAILAGRPVITSAVCPALEYIKDAAIEVSPDDVQSYLRAVLALSRDSALYEKKRLSCRALQEQFYDQGNSWGARVTEAIAVLTPKANSAATRP